MCRSYGAFVVCVGVATNIPLRSELNLDKYFVTIRMIPASCVSAVNSIPMRILVLIFTVAAVAYAQNPPIEPGVSQELARWRSARYSHVWYKLNLTLEKMSPVLKGTIEIRVNVGDAEIVMD